jgi:hypothetical protein
VEGSPEKIVLEFDLANFLLDADGGTFLDYVADLAASKLMETGDAREATGQYRRRALSIADEEIREQLKPVIADALDAAAQRTSPFGDPRGEPRTLRELIVETALDQLRTRQGVGGARRETLVESVVRKEVQEALGSDLKAAVASARAEVLAAVTEKAAEVISETIARAAEGRRV